jgi:UDP-GlcNAc:undecaprenyl-phosphate/decaprenyl-phosphate GlcNAc-1-phosphate transferase
MIVTVAVGFLLSVTGTEAVRRLALARGITDQPGGHKPHSRPTPLLGGVAVMAATAFAVALTHPHLGSRPAAILVAGLAMGGLGLLDDLRPLSARTRLIVEACAATTMTFAGIRAPLTGDGRLDAALTVLWLVLVINATNLLDNADAALSMPAAATATGIAVAALASATDTAVVAAAGAAAAGFLVHNWPPARIFLGDAGSLFLGTVLAASAVDVSRTLPGPVAAAWLLLIMLLACTDTVTVVISRRRAGRSVLLGGSDHLSHRLRRLGLTPQHAAIALGITAAVAAAAACLVAAGHLPATAAILGGLASIGTAACLAQRVDCYAPAAPAPSPRAAQPHARPLATTGRVPRE